jgi:hypothetical protein
VFDGLQQAIEHGDTTLETATELPTMANTGEKTNRLLEVLRSLARGFADQYVRGVTMQYRYLIDGPPQGVGGPRTSPTQETHDQ